ncbi:MAG: DUF3576 domain-containing protein [Pseudomonadota bacterium]
MYASVRLTALGLCIAGVTACGGEDSAERDARLERQLETVEALQPNERGSLLEFFNAPDESRQINVNRYLWTASLDILSLFPIEAADPFSGVISTDWGQPSGSGNVYRATVFVTGPSLDAQSLKVAVFRRSGGRAVPVGDATAEQIEDAILTRARQFLRADEQRG